MSSGAAGKKRRQDGNGEEKFTERATIGGFCFLVWWRSGEDGLERRLLLLGSPKRSAVPAHPLAGLFVARLQDSRVHQPLGCEDKWRAPRSQQDS